MDNLNKCLLEKIKYKFIFDNIFQYISKSFIKYKLELFKYSKSFKQKLDIDLNDYKYNYFDNKFNIYKYPSFDFKKENFDKNYLIKEAENILKLKSLNFSIDEIVDITRKYNEKYRKYEKRNKLDIFLCDKKYHFDFVYDIYCPFIDFSSYHDNYFFKIPLNYIEKYNLINDYELFLIKNKKSNNLLYITFDNNDQIKILKEIKIDYSKIKILYFKLNYYFDMIININNSFFSEMFLLINIKNNYHDKMKNL